MDLDLHLHTSFSPCSTLALEDLVQLFLAQGHDLATIADFGITKSCGQLREMLPNMVVICGVELKAEEGDFLVYSPDEAYLRSLPVEIGSVKNLRRNEQTAVIWAHPRVSQRARSYEAPSLPEVQKVVPYIDGLELYNGTMLSLHKEGLLRHDYFHNLVRIIMDYGLAMTGGSDARDRDLAFKCITRVPDDIHDALSLVEAIKNRRVIPAYDHEYFGVVFSLT